MPERLDTEDFLPSPEWKQEYFNAPAGMKSLLEDFKEELLYGAAPQPSSKFIHPLGRAIAMFERFAQGAVEFNEPPLLRWKGRGERNPNSVAVFIDYFRLYPAKSQRRTAQNDSGLLMIKNGVGIGIVQIIEKVLIKSGKLQVC